MSKREEYGHGRCQLGWKFRKRVNRRRSLEMHCSHLRLSDDQKIKLTKESNFSKLPEEVRDALRAKL